MRKVPHPPIFLSFHPHHCENEFMFHLFDPRSFFFISLIYSPGQTLLSVYRSLSASALSSLFVKDRSSNAVQSYTCGPCIPSSLSLSPLFLSLLPIPQPTSFHFCNFVWVGCTTSLPVIRMSFLCCVSPSFYFSPGVLTLWGFYLPPLKGCPFLLCEKKGFQMKWKQLCCPLWTHTIISW